MSQDPIDQRLLACLATAYDAVPQGLVLEYLPGHAIRRVKSEPLELRGLDFADGVVSNEIVPAYRTALLLRGRYLAVAGRYDEAIAAFNDALRIDPENATVQAERARTELARDHSLAR